MMPLRLDFEVWTNSDYFEEWYFKDGDDAVDLTSYTLEMVAKDSLGGDVLFTLADNAAIYAQGIYRVEPANGVIRLNLLKETILSAYNAVNPAPMLGERVLVPYSFIVSDANVEELWWQGYVIINKGV